MSFDIQKIGSSFQPANALNSKVLAPVKPQSAPSSTAIATISPVKIELAADHSEYQKEYENLQRAVRNHEPYFARTKAVLAFEKLAASDWQTAKAKADLLPESYLKAVAYTLLARLGHQGNVPELLKEIKKNTPEGSRFYPEMAVLEHYIKIPELAEVQKA